MPKESIDLTVTSPPYDNLRKYNGYNFDVANIIEGLFKVTKQGGVVVWVVGDATIDGSETGSAFRQALNFIQCGFRLHDTMIYQKINYIPLTHNRYEQAFEYMFVFSKGKPKTFNPIREKTFGAGSKYNLKRKGYCSTIKEGAQRRRDENIVTNETKIKSNIFQYTLGADRVGHPAPFPEQLSADQIFSWSNEGDIVYDCFGGSGTTIKMVHILKRKWIMSEISKEYCDIAFKRIQPFLQQQTFNF